MVHFKETTNFVVLSRIFYGFLENLQRWTIRKRNNGNNGNTAIKNSGISHLNLIDNFTARYYLELQRLYPALS